MITGHGHLTFRSGRQVAVSYQFGSDCDDRRTGYLSFDMSEIDPADLYGRLKLCCDDGATVILAVIRSSDKHLGVMGRVVLMEDATPSLSGADEAA